MISKESNRSYENAESESSATTPSNTCVKGNSQTAHRIFHHLHNLFKSPKNTSNKDWSLAQFKRNIKILGSNELETFSKNNNLNYEKFIIKLYPNHSQSILYESPDITFDSSSSFRVKPLNFNEANYILNTGLPISDFDWFFDRKNQKSSQYIAVGVYDKVDYSPLYCSFNDKETKSYLQIWDLGELKLVKNKIIPKLVAIFELDWGFISALKWLPFQYKPRSDFIGNLIVCTNDGFVRIISIPKFNSNEKTKLNCFKIPNSSIILLSPHHGKPSIKIGWPTCLSIVRENPSILGIGYSTGYIGIYEMDFLNSLNFRMGQSESEPCTLRPSFLHRLSHSPTCSLTFNPYNLSTLVVSSFDNHIRLYNLNDCSYIGLLNPLIDHIPARLGGEALVVWPVTRPDMFIVGSAEKPSKTIEENYINSFLPSHPSHNFKLLIPFSNGSVKSMDFSELLNVVIAVDSNGGVQICSPLSDQRQPINPLPRFFNKIHKVLFRFDLKNTEETDIRNYRVHVSTKAKDTLKDAYLIKIHKYFNANKIKFNQNLNASTWWAMSMRIGLIQFHCLDGEFYHNDLPKILKQPNPVETKMGSFYSIKTLEFSKGFKKLQEKKRSNDVSESSEPDSDSESEASSSSESNCSNVSVKYHDTDTSWTEISDKENSLTENDSQSNNSSTSLYEADVSGNIHEKTHNMATIKNTQDTTVINASDVSGTLNEKNQNLSELRSSENSMVINETDITITKNIPEADSTQAYFNEICAEELEKFKKNSSNNSNEEASTMPSPRYFSSPSSSISSDEENVVIGLEKAGEVFSEVETDINSENKRPFESSSFIENKSQSFADIVSIAGERDSSDEESEIEDSKLGIKKFNSDDSSKKIRFITVPKSNPRNVPSFNDDQVVNTEISIESFNLNLPQNEFFKQDYEENSESQTSNNNSSALIDIANQILKKEFNQRKMICSFIRPTKKTHNGKKLSPRRNPVCQFKFFSGQKPTKKMKDDNSSETQLPTMNSTPKQRTNISALIKSPLYNSQSIVRNESTPEDPLAVEKSSASNLNTKSYATRKRAMEISRDEAHSPIKRASKVNSKERNQEKSIELSERRVINDSNSHSNEENTSKTILSPKVGDKTSMKNNNDKEFSGFSDSSGHKSRNLSHQTDENLRSIRRSSRINGLVSPQIDFYQGNEGDTMTKTVKNTTDPLKRKLRNSRIEKTDEANTEARLFNESNQTNTEVSVKENSEKLFTKRNLRNSTSKTEDESLSSNKVQNISQKTDLNALHSKSSEIPIRLISRRSNKFSSQITDISLETTSSCKNKEKENKPKGLNVPEKKNTRSMSTLSSPTSSHTTFLHSPFSELVVEENRIIRSSSRINNQKSLLNNSMQETELETSNRLIGNPQVKNGNKLISSPVGKKKCGLERETLNQFISSAKKIKVTRTSNRKSIIRTPRTSGINSIEKYMTPKKIVTKSEPQESQNHPSASLIDMGLVTNSLSKTKIKSPIQIPKEIITTENSIKTESIEQPTTRILRPSKIDPDESNQDIKFQPNFGTVEALNISSDDSDHGTMSVIRRRTSL